MGTVEGQRDSTRQIRRLPGLAHVYPSPLDWLMNGGHHSATDAVLGTHYKRDNVGDTHAVSSSCGIPRRSRRQPPIYLCTAGPALGQHLANLSRGKTAAISGAIDHDTKQPRKRALRLAGLRQKLNNDDAGTGSV